MDQLRIVKKKKQEILKKYFSFFFLFTVTFIFVRFNNKKNKNYSHFYHPYYYYYYYFLSKFKSLFFLILIPPFIFNYMNMEENDKKNSCFSILFFHLIQHCLVNLTINELITDRSLPLQKRDKRQWRHMFPWWRYRSADIIFNAIGFRKVLCGK